MAVKVREGGYDYRHETREEANVLFEIEGGTRAMGQVYLRTILTIILVLVQLVYTLQNRVVNQVRECYSYA